jgi:acetyl-CoA C-acetyltransferase
MLAKLHSGLPDSCAAQTINNYCSSGLSAIGHGAAMIAAGQAERALAGGVEMMSRVPFLSDQARFYDDLTLPPRARFVPPVLAADRLANSERITRAELDAAALVSQQRAAASDADPALQASRIPAGRLNGEECPRGGTTAEGLAALPPAFGKLQDHYAGAIDNNRFDPLHTLSHAPPVCDGAGLALLGGEGLNARPRARVLAYAESGGDPVASLTAGMAAMDKALSKAGVTLDAIDRIEFMEAFAVSIAKFMRDYRPDPDRVNVSGGHLAKGHPMGATGQSSPPVCLMRSMRRGAGLGWWSRPARWAWARRWWLKGSDPAHRGRDQKHPGWGGRIRTSACRYQKPVPYRLATPQQERGL